VAAQWFKPLHGPPFAVPVPLPALPRVHVLLPELSCHFSTILPRRALRPHASTVCNQTQPPAAAAHCVTAMRPVPPAAVHATHELPHARRVEELREHDHVGSTVARHDIDRVVVVRGEE